MTFKIGDRIFVRGYIDEIRKDTVIVRNDGGYFGTILSEVTGELPSAQPKREKGKWIADNHDFWVCSNCKFPSEAHGANILYKFCPNCGADMRGEQE